MNNTYKKLYGKEALEIADMVRLTIWQESASPFDGITSFQFGPDPVKVKKNIFKIIEHPVLYYCVQETETHYYINFLIYHPFDWADHKLWIFSDYVNKKDSHRDDTESVLIEYSKRDGTINMVTVSHFSHIFGWDMKPEIIIKSQSHAILPKKDEEIDQKRMHRIYLPFSYRLENIFDWSDEKLRQILHHFKLNKDANWIDEQYDGILKNETFQARYRSQGLQHFVGDIIKDPAKLIEIGRESGR